MKKILLMLMLVCISKPVSAWDCNVYYESDVPYTPEQICSLGYTYRLASLVDCKENQKPQTQFHHFVKGSKVYFCGYLDQFSYGHGTKCPFLSESTLPSRERKDVSACNICVNGAVGTPPNDCRCKTGYYQTSNHYCGTCPEGTTSPEGSIGASACKASLPENCATASGNTCTTCNAGYFLSNGSCAACPANATCDGTATITCAAGYELSGSTCVVNLPENCATGSSGACTKCNTGYSLVSGACVKNKANCKAPLKLSADGCCCTL